MTHEEAQIAQAAFVASKAELEAYAQAEANSGYRPLMLLNERIETILASAETLIAALVDELEP